MTEKGTRAYVSPWRVSALHGFSESASLAREDFVPLGIMHNSMFKGHPISLEREGTEPPERELMARAVLYNVALVQL